MSTLVVRHYRSSLFAKLADHTYVACGTGAKAWGCWGGKTGGAALRQGSGSTRRADAIAEPDEHAGITCYLVNGVCHQAANRILLPAGITARGARGYEVSAALFGVYGRPRGGFRACRAPFEEHAGVTGDLPECAGAARGGRTLPAGERRAERRYLRDVLALYRRAERRLRSVRGPVGPELEDFLVELFMRQVRHRLGGGLGRAATRKLRDIRASTERSRLQLEEWFAREALTAGEFAAAFNTETILFQDAVAGVLAARQYRALFGLRRGEALILADPRIVRRAYGR